MEQTKQKIEIVEYHEGLAAGVAEMWNLSRDGWGGDSHVTTEEKVRTQEANSSNLNLYLAMDGDKVVGYCGLCEYREDEGALYIPLLNVRSDYHGKKIGKQLVLKALERAVELNWPRLDLYTWPGNSKAVPLYKKCGFFWEDRDDTTHLMNFMPTVLNTEAIKDYFTNVDWYDASTRVIEVTPDGKKENDFTYYEYKWNSNGDELRLGFERTGRGLRSIETNDYSITVEVENFTLVCDAAYTVRYFIKNKSGKPLQIDLKGKDHKIVRYSYEHSLSVNEETVLEATFHLENLVEEQSNWRTHPSVVTNMLINGKEATFAVGILPKLPAKLKGVVPGSQCYLNEKAVFYLDLENNFSETASFILTVPENELVSLKQSEFSVTLAPKEKTSIPVPYTLLQYGFYAPVIRVSVERENGGSQQFTKQIGVAFKGLGARFAGECDDYWHIYNGLYHLYLSKFDNKLIPGRATKGSQSTMFMYPKLGKPYSSELSKRKPSFVEYKEENGAMVLYATYESSDFANIELVSVSKLYGEGLVEQSYLVRNKNTSNTADPVWIYQPIYHELVKPILPMKGQVVKVEDQAYSDYGVWNSADLTENWLFSRHDSYAHGVSWPNDARVNFETWFFYVEHNLGNIPANGEISTKPVYHSLGAYQNWEEFREFALKKTVRTAATVDDLFFQKEELEMKLVDRKANYIQGEVTLNGKTITVSAEDEKREVDATIEMKTTPLSTVVAEYEINGIKDCKKALTINPSNKPITIQKEMRDGVEVVTATNEEISIAAAESFYPALFSLKVNEKEWLDTSFPTLKPKSWWNPWSGGIRSGLLGINNKSFTKEKTIIGEGKLEDQEGRVWKGLKISTVFTENETYKGLGIHQYYLMLPGVPVVAFFTKITQNTGTYFHYKKWFTECNFQLGWVQNTESDRKYIAGKTEFQAGLSDHTIVGTTTDEQILQLVAEREAVDVESYMNKEVMLFAIWREIQMANGTELLSAPSFIVGSDKILSSDEVKDLQRMTFKEVEDENN
ncbi:GNAT family N-acetyltransferase [Bacillus luteolus]|uniref:GNAT family N-acetyltransferase n=1 Tax=Litchfieldia luteola TaxID=682179 RepID=A0ABR9QGR1_9BACI|nr:GNAT family N-acetyltransferase [Cytobacillus luteolus]MBE4907671.1 GNAT family N-acetyltransferase [Cytobacillus luteolus]MBP1941122.1 GNAT superfamily N-acetyltransferase [Cytobacillus luteolus]